MLMREHVSAKIPNEIKQPARADAIRILAEFVCSHAREIGFEDGKIREMGVAMEETLGNIVRFACADGTREISIRCTEHEMGPLVINIRDSGVPFNMLVATSFPQTADFVDPGQALSTSKMKRTFKNIEYRRDSENGRNILVCIVSR